MHANHAWHSSKLGNNACKEEYIMAAGGSAVQIKCWTAAACTHLEWTVKDPDTSQHSLADATAPQKRLQRDTEA
jgi:hypothetical protein